VPLPPRTPTDPLIHHWDACRSMNHRCWIESAWPTTTWRGTSRSQPPCSSIRNPDEVGHSVIAILLKYRCHFGTKTLLVLIRTAMETSDGQAVCHLSLESWLDESAAPFGSSSHGFSTPTKNPYVPTTVSLSCLSFFVTSLHIEQLV
jgi:hypothetical protein